MDPEAQLEVAAKEVERRRHARYRLVQALVISSSKQFSCKATTSDISISGLSATSSEELRIGENVHLFPVVGQRVAAVVRRKEGAIYGFEFTDLPDPVVADIHALCRGLFPFRGIAEYSDAG
jgi:PilZ domain-containing protein